MNARNRRERSLEKPREIDGRLTQSPFGSICCRPGSNLENRRSMTDIFRPRQHALRRHTPGWKWLHAQLFVLLFTTHMPDHALAVEPAYENFQSPVGIASIAGKALYVSDWSNDTVTRIDANGARSVVAKDVPAAAGLAIDRRGAVFIASYSADYILRLDPDGSSHRIAEHLSTPTGLAFSEDGRLLVANRGAGQIVAVNVSTGRIDVVADGLSLPVGVVEMDDGSIVVSQYGGRVTRILRNGRKQELGAGFDRPGVGIAKDGPDAVLVVDNGAGVVRRVTFDGKASAVTEKLPGSAVALGKGLANEWLAGAWGTGVVYRFRP